MVLQVPSTVYAPTSLTLHGQCTPLTPAFLPPSNSQQLELMTPWELSFANA